MNVGDNPRQPKDDKRRPQQPYGLDDNGEEMTLINPQDQADPEQTLPAGGPAQARQGFAGSPPQGYPPYQGTPPQGYPSYQGSPPQGYPSYQGSPPQGYPPYQGSPPQGYPPYQGTPPQGYRGTPPQGYPPPGTPPSGYGSTRATMPQYGSGQTPVTGAGGGSGGQELALEGTVLADYLIENKLGQGGMGAVYKGRQLSLDRPVAIKVLPAHLSKDASFIERFQLEARAVAKLTHQNIIQVYGAGEAGGMHYFAMEFVAGKDLSQRLKDGYRPTPAESVELMLQAARGLAEAGRHNIVHRDIKPHNMMVTDEGQLKIMDFGLVKMTDDTHALTMTGAIMGTVSYFSPEQGRGERCDCRTDIYALGITFYELLAGSVPFTGNDASSIIYQHIHSAPRPLEEVNPDIPDEIQAVVLKCLAKRREDRYQSAAALLKDLEAIHVGVQPPEAMRDAAQLRQKAGRRGPRQQAESRSSILPKVLLAESR
ncbi:MAG: protein kinase domain-containing protein, partial [Planctomycetota bacterium]